MISGTSWLRSLFLHIPGHLLGLACHCHSPHNHCWPSDEEEDEDDEYEVSEKRKKTENDCGMEEFEKFLMKTDKKEKPNKGTIMMMENLSASSSTIGMMQEYDHGLFEAIENILR